MFLIESVSFLDEIQFFCVQLMIWQTCLNSLHTRDSIHHTLQLYSNVNTVHTPVMTLLLAPKWKHLLCFHPPNHSNKHLTGLSHLLMSGYWDHSIIWSLCNGASGADFMIKYIILIFKFQMNNMLSVKSASQHNKVINIF